MTPPTKCPVCLCEASASEKDYGSSAIVDCPRCGRYRIPVSLIADWQQNDTRRARVSHQIRLMQRSGTRAEISPEMLTRMASTILPSVGSQMDSLVLWLAKKTIESPGVIRVLSDEEALECAAAVGAADHRGFKYIYNSLRSAGLLASETPLSNAPILVLTPLGWSRYEVLTRTVPDSRVAFMAMPFGLAAVNEAFENCFQHAATRAGYELRPVTDRQPAGIIDDQIKVRIRIARFVIADLTGGNQGAYWEAGFAEGLGKPVVYTCEAAEFDIQKTHFDTNHRVTIPWALDQLREAEEKLVAIIRNTLPDEAKLAD